MARHFAVILPPILATGVAVPADSFWAIVEQGRIVQSGRDDRWVSLLHEADDSPPLTVFARASDMAIRWFSYPDLEPVQAMIVAQRSVIEASLGNAEDLHSVSGYPATLGDKGEGEDQSEGENQGEGLKAKLALVPAGVVRHDLMQAWLQWLNEHGVSARAIVPLTAIVRPPPEGAALRVEAWGEELLRVKTVSMCCDSAIDPLLIGDARVEEHSEAMLYPELLLALEAPPMNLLVGRWRVRRTFAITPEQKHRIAKLVAGVLVLTIAGFVGQGLRFYIAASRADARSVEVASKAGIEAVDAKAAEVELNRRLIEQGGGPLAFSVPVSALYGVMETLSSVTLRKLSYRGDGVLTVVLAAPRIEDINRLLLQLQMRNYRVTAQPMPSANGMQIAMITIRAVP